MSEKKVWFITGAARGLGRSLAEEVLAAGGRVAATARRSEVLQDLVEKYPKLVITLESDVTNRESVKNAVRRTVEEFGKIDVIVNNAGYGLVGVIEEPTDEQIRQQFETNVFGVLNVLRESLPVLRGQKSGHIINISSRLGFFGFPSYGYYSATKYALHGISESVAQETAPFGIKVTIAEPGGIRTEFNGKSVVKAENVLPEDYPSTDAFINRLAMVDGKQLSDPHKIARLLIEITEIENPPLHLPLGEDAYTAIEEQFKNLLEEISLWREKGIATGYKSAAV